MNTPNLFLASARMLDPTFINLAGGFLALGASGAVAIGCAIYRRLNRR